MNMTAGRAVTDAGAVRRVAVVRHGRNFASVAERRWHDVS